MKISPINVNYQQKSVPTKRKFVRNEPVIIPENTNINFQGKHDCAKLLGGICGALGVAGAAGGILIMTGGLGAAALPWILGYGATSAGIGAALGHQVDKDQNNSQNK